MPRLSNDMETHAIGKSAFSFTGTRVNHLTATEYTLVTVAVDTTSSVMNFANDLRNMLIVAVDACKKSPRSDNILVRVLTFNSHALDEIHGFKPLEEINTADYPQFSPSGMTPLNDAIFSAIGATNSYAEQLTNLDYNVNAIFFVITDGGENSSSTSVAMVQYELNKAVMEEKLESVLSILIGVNTSTYNQLLQKYQQDTGMSMFIDGGTADASGLAKVAKFVSQSVSSQSQSLGTGGASQNISASI